MFQYLSDGNFHDLHTLHSMTQKSLKNYRLNSHAKRLETLDITRQARVLTFEYR